MWPKDPQIKVDSRLYLSLFNDFLKKETFPWFNIHWHFLKNVFTHYCAFVLCYLCGYFCPRTPVRPVTKPATVLPPPAGDVWLLPARASYLDGQRLETHERPGDSSTWPQRPRKGVHGATLPLLFSL